MKRDYAEDDLRLVEACVKRDLVAWSIFVKKYSRLIYISIDNRLKKYGISLPAQDIEDIRQNVLSGIWKDGKLEDVRRRDNIAYWLSIVSGNRALEYARKKRSCELPSIPLSCNLSEDVLIGMIPSGSAGPDELCAGKEIRERVEKAIESLPAKEKLITKLHLLHGKKYYEISRILNLPTGTVSSYMKRAKEKLQKNLGDLQQF